MVGLCLKLWLFARKNKTKYRLFSRGVLFAYFEEVLFLKGVVSPRSSLPGGWIERKKEKKWHCRVIRSQVLKDLKGWLLSKTLPLREGKKGWYGIEQMWYLTSFFYTFNWHLGSKWALLSRALEVRVCLVWYVTDQKRGLDFMRGFRGR